MANTSPQFDRTNAMVAGAVFLAVLTIYSLTMAPTVSFWDCGEFIAVSHALGIPHPPGTPLYVLIGRLCAIIPIIPELSARINFLSALSNAVAALFGYLVTVRLLRGWFAAPLSSADRLIVYLSAAVGSAMLAFGLTQWNNSVETEVYGVAMAIFMIVAWLGMRYHELPAGPDADRIVVLAFFLAVLGVGIHLTTFLIVPAVALLFVVRKGAPVETYYLLAGLFAAELLLVVVCSARTDELALTVPFAIAAPLVSGYVLALTHPSRPLLIAMAATVLLGLAAILPATTLPSVLALAGEVIGAIGLVVSLVMWRSERSKRTGDFAPDSPDQFIPVAIAILFALVCAVLIACDFRGYELFLALSTVLLGLIGYILRDRLHWAMVIALLGVSTVAIGVYPFLIGAAGTITVLLLLGKRLFAGQWKVAAVAVAVATIGFSVHLFIPIRSAQQPSINQNDPSRSVQATVDFIERKQYGSESMITRMFERRGSWQNQFGDYPRMGFVGFLKKQFSTPAELFESSRGQIAMIGTTLTNLSATGMWYALLALLALFGVWEAIRRTHGAGLMLTILLILGSVGLILYMNFADGTRIDPQTGEDYLEVRDRDYFFTPAFLILGLFIGIGVASVIVTVRDLFAATSRLRQRVSVALAILACGIPTIAVAGNWYQTDRSRNVIPYDYAKNLLMSCEPESVLFTYGDNDTFPLWCLQEAYGYRTDVRIVNLSLGNTDWYIRQVQQSMGVPLGWSDEQIANLRPYRTADGTVYRIQDQLIDAIVSNNRTGRPIQFSTTVSENGRRLFGKPVDSRLQLRGMVFLLRDSAAGMTVDVERCQELFLGTNGFSYRGLNDETIYKDNATLGTVSNAVNGMIMLADTLRSRGDYAQAEQVMAHAVAQMPFVSGAAEYLGMIYAQQGKVQELEELLSTPRYQSIDRLVVARAQLDRQNGLPDAAVERLRSYLASNPDRRAVLDELMRIHVIRKDVAGMTKDLRIWTEQNPHDREIASALQQLLADTAILHRVGKSGQ